MGGGFASGRGCGAGLDTAGEVGGWTAVSAGAVVGLVGCRLSWYRSVTERVKRP